MIVHISIIRGPVVFSCKTIIILKTMLFKKLSSVWIVLSSMSMKSYFRCISLSKYLGYKDYFVKLGLFKKVWGLGTVFPWETSPGCWPHLCDLHIGESWQRETVGAVLSQHTLVTPALASDQDFHIPTPSLPWQILLTYLLSLSLADACFLLAWPCLTTNQDC